MVNYSEPIKKAIVANSVSSARPEGSGALVNICCPDRLRGGPGRCRPHPGAPREGLTCSCTLGAWPSNRHDGRRPIKPRAPFAVTDGCHVHRGAVSPHYPSITKASRSEHTTTGGLSCNDGPLP